MIVFTLVPTREEPRDAYARLNHNRIDDAVRDREAAAGRTLTKEREAELCRLWDAEPDCLKDVLENAMAKDFQKDLDACRAWDNDK